MKEFEQLPKESAKAFEAFSIYLNLGAERSVAAVGRKLGKSEGLMERWASRFDWTGRVRAYEEHLALVEREATEALVRVKAAGWLKRQQELLEVEWAIHEECIAGAREALKRFYDRGKGATLGDIARMFAEASRIGRLACGMPTDRTEVTGEDGGPIRVEFEAALKKVYGVAAPPAISPSGREVIDVEALPSATGKAVEDL